MAGRDGEGEQNTVPSGPVFGDRDVSDIQGSIRVLNTKVENLTANKADKIEVAELKSEWKSMLLSIITPLLAALATGVILAVIN